MKTKWTEIHKLKKKEKKEKENTDPKKLERELALKKKWKWKHPTGCPDKIKTGFFSMKYPSQPKPLNPK